MSVEEPVWCQLIKGIRYATRYPEPGCGRQRRGGKIRRVGKLSCAGIWPSTHRKSYERVAMERFEIEGGKIKRRWGGKGLGSAGPAAGNSTERMTLTVSD